MDAFALTTEEELDSVAKADEPSPSLDIELVKAFTNEEYFRTKEIALLLLENSNLDSAVRKDYILMLAQAVASTESLSVGLALLQRELDGTDDDFLLLSTAARIALNAGDYLQTDTMCDRLLAKLQKRLEKSIALDLQSYKIEATWILLTSCERQKNLYRVEELRRSLLREGHLTADHYSVSELERLVSNGQDLDFCRSYLRRLRIDFKQDLKNNRCATQASPGHECDFIDVLLVRLGERADRDLSPTEPLPLFYSGSVRKKTLI